jgi:hypothetical protein
MASINFEHQVVCLDMLFSGWFRRRSYADAQDFETCIKKPFDHDRSTVMWLYHTCMHRHEPSRVQSLSVLVSLSLTIQPEVRQYSLYLVLFDAFRKPSLVFVEDISVIIVAEKSGCDFRQEQCVHRPRLQPKPPGVEGDC